MKKVSLFLLIFVVAFSLAGCEKKNDEPIKVSEKTSLKKMLDSGESQKCTVVVQDAVMGSVSTQELYLDGKRFRANTMVEDAQADQPINVYTISDDDWMYVWGSLQETGTKISLAKLEEMKTEGEDVEEYEPINEEEDFDYKCEKWQVDESVFQAPTDIQFVDLTQMLTGFDTSSSENGGENDMCGVCQMMPAGNDKDDCLVNLGC